MLLLFVILWSLAGAAFSFASSPEPIIWAGALVGQGCYSGGRLVASAMTSDDGRFALLSGVRPHQINN